MPRAAEDVNRGIGHEARVVHERIPVGQPDTAVEAFLTRVTVRAFDARPALLWVEHADHKVTRARGGVRADGRPVEMAYVNFLEYFDFRLERGR